MISPEKLKNETKNQAGTIGDRERRPQCPRRSRRVALRCEAILRQHGHCNYRVRLDDASLHGCRIEFVDRPRLGDRTWVKLGRLEGLEALVRWVDGFTAGVEFEKPIHPAVFDVLVGNLKRPPAGGA